MDILFDWLLIFFSSIITICAYKRIIFRENTSIANYIIIILYVFCVLPILLNYLIGIPEYNTVYWYKPFVSPMENETVNVIYDIYIFIAIVSLYIILGRKRLKFELRQENTLTSLFVNNKILSIILIILPVLYILVTGSWSYYAVFAVASTRGLTEAINLSWMTPFMLISMFTFFSVVFKENLTLKKIIITCIYSFGIVWISGKRFMIANILVLVIFYVVNLIDNVEIKKKMYKIIPFLGVILIAFSAFYLVKIRPMSETSVMSVYDMLRVDFGRDDVIKYVINEEIIEGNRILDYRGESFLSLIASFVPREIWSSKPYPHYMYLTASILNVNMFELPAGTTPSLLEMTICNFGDMGFFVGILILLLLCKVIDRFKDIDTKAIGLILFIVLLTQSMDVYLIAVALLAAMKLLTSVCKNHRIRIVLRR